MKSKTYYLNNSDIPNDVNICSLKEKKLREENAKLKCRIILLIFSLAFNVLCVSFLFFGDGLIEQINRYKTFKSTLQSQSEQIPSNKTKTKTKKYKAPKQNSNLPQVKVINETELKNRKTIKIKYLDFWENFKPENFIIHRMLTEKYNVNITEDFNTDFVFYSIYGNNNSFYSIRQFIRIQFIADNISPDLDNVDYSLGYNYLTFEDRYQRFPAYLLNLSGIDLENRNQYNDDIKSKKFCGIIVENATEGSDFQKYFLNKLAKYKPLDMFVFDKVKFNYNENFTRKEFLSDYKFSIQFEKSQTTGYISEKIFEGFSAGTIPIYFGDNNITDIINPKSFVHLKSYEDVERVIDLVIKLDKNEKLYRKMLNEKVLIDDKHFEKEYKKAREFLYHIFDQDRLHVKRYTRSGFYWFG